MVAANSEFFRLHVSNLGISHRLAPSLPLPMLGTIECS